VEEVVDVVGRDRRAHPDLFGLVGGHARVRSPRATRRSIRLLAEDLFGLFPLDHCGTVVWIDDAIADFEGHSPLPVVRRALRDRSVYQGERRRPVRADPSLAPAP
jgi:hypothetical protein